MFSEIFGNTVKASSSSGTVNTNKFPYKSELMKNGQFLQASGGGKLHVFMSSLPKVGSKALNVREQHGTVNGTQPLTVMQPCSKEYRELAEDAASNAVNPNFQTWLKPSWNEIK